MKTLLIAGNSPADNQQPSSKEKVQRLERKLVHSSEWKRRGSQAECDIVCSVWQHTAGIISGDRLTNYLEHKDTARLPTNTLDSLNGNTLHQLQ